MNIIERVHRGEVGSERSGAEQRDDDSKSRNANAEQHKLNLTILSP